MSEEMDIKERLNWGSYNGLRTFGLYHEWAKEMFDDEHSADWYYDAVVFTLAALLDFERDRGYSFLDGWEDTIVSDVATARKYMKGYVDRANEQEKH